MRISELAETSGLPVATLKFYLRSGLLPPGRAVSRTLADYDDEHVERLRLIRALTEVGGLDLARVARILEAVDAGAEDRLDVLATAQRALAEPPAGVATDAGSSSSEDAPHAHSHTSGDDPTRAWLARRGWSVDPADPAIDLLAEAWAACAIGDVGVGADRLDEYADAVEHIARIDVASVPDEPAAAVRQVVLGTVLVEPLLRALRLLAQQHVAVTTA